MQDTEVATNDVAVDQAAATLNRLVARLHKLHNVHQLDLDDGGSSWDVILDAVKERSLDEVATYVLADPTPKKHCFQTGMGKDWLSQAASSGELMQRLATMVVVAKLCQLRTVLQRSA